MITVDITVDDHEVRELFADLKQRMPNVQRMIMRKSGSVVVKETKNGPLSGTVLGVRSGKYRNSLYSRTKGGEGFVGIRSPLGHIWEKTGANITPKSGGKYLRFPLVALAVSRDVWVTVRSVHLSPRPALLPVLERFFSSGEAETVGQQIMDREIAKAQAKYGN